MSAHNLVDLWQLKKADNSNDPGANLQSPGVSRLALALTVTGILSLSTVSAGFAEKIKVDSSGNSGVISGVANGASSKDSIKESATVQDGESATAQTKQSATAQAKEGIKSQLRDSMNSHGEFINTASDDTGEEIPANKLIKPSTDVIGDTVDDVNARKAKEAAIQNNQAVEHYELGQHYMHKFDWEMSELELEAAIMYSPTMKAAHRDYCVVSVMRGQGLRSVAEFMMVVGLGDPIPLNEEEKAALVKKGAKMHYQKGIKYGAQHDWKKATPEFQWALTYAPTSAAIAHSLAFSYAADGDFEKAESEYLKAFALDPTNSNSHADFAILLSEHGDQKLAMKELAKAIALSPGVAALHVDMAWLAESSGDFKTAETEFHQAVQLSPRHAGLWSHLGRVEERLGKARDAKIAYNEALAVDPGDDEARARLNALNKTAPAVTPSGGEEPAPVSPQQPKKQS